MPSATFESPELVALFTTYTASPHSIGAHLARAAVSATEHDPLLVVTGTDLVLYPGSGKPPRHRALPARHPRLQGTGRHLPPRTRRRDACPTARTGGRQRRRQRPPRRHVGQREGRGGWRADAARLLDATEAARAANSPSLWRDQLAVRAFAGREDAIAAMIDYACALTERFLHRALADPGYLTMANVRRDYLAGPTGDGGLPVPFNRVMIATFYLTGMDIAHRLIGWLDAAGIDWARAMVIFAGQAGRPTAGVTQESHSIAGVVRAVSGGLLAPERVFIAPHAPVLPPHDPAEDDTTAASDLEPGYRRLWAGLRATSELAGGMFDGYPRFAARGRRAARNRPRHHQRRRQARPQGPDDWFALVTRLRVVMEDPTQLLSGAVTDYASAELVAHRNDPSAVTVPGLDGEPYPQRETQ